MAIRMLKPKRLGELLGLYSFGVVAPAGELVVVAGQIGVDGTGRVAGPDIATQTRQTFENVRTVLAEAGCAMRDVIRFQTFLTRPEDVEGFMRVRREVFSQYYPDGMYPPNTLVIVSRLVQPELQVEIEALAVRPGRPAARQGKPKTAARRGRPRKKRR